MASTAATYFLASSSETCSGCTAWSDTDNALIEAGYTTCTLPSGSFFRDTEELALTNADFDVPADATIDGFVVQVRASESGASSVAYNRVHLTKDGTSFSSDNKATGTVTTTEATRTFGGASDLWGIAWTEAEVNASSFGVIIKLRNSDTDNETTVSVKWVTVTVYYTPGPVEVDAALTIGAPVFAAEIDTKRDVTVALTLGAPVLQALIGPPGVYAELTIGAPVIAADVEVLNEASVALTIGAPDIAVSVNSPGITPGRPENVKAARSVDFETVTLTWDDVDETTGYVVFQADARRATFAEVDTPSSATLEITSLVAETSYNFKVQAISTTGHPGPHSSVVFTKGKNTTL